MIMECNIFNPFSSVILRTIIDYINGVHIIWYSMQRILD